jgi:tripartite ATP-independent transporter DctP family solute receptor
MKRTMFMMSLGLFLVIMLSTSPVSSQTVEIKLAHGGPPAMALQKAALHFQKYLDLATGGTMKVAIFPAGQLGNERVMAEGVQHGTIQMAILSDVILSNFVPQVGVMTLPFLFPNREAVYKVQDGEIGRKLFSLFPEKGMVALAWGENGFRNFVNAKKPIKTLSDMKDLKMRCMEGAIYIDSFKALGINPVPMPWAETINAIKQGVVDGTDLPYNAILLTGMYEAAKYITDIKWVYSGLVMVANKGFYDALTADQKRLLREAAFEFQLMNRSIDATDAMSSREQLLQKGAQITDVGPKDRALYRTATQKVHQEWMKKLGEDLIKSIYKEVEKYEYE